MRFSANKQTDEVVHSFFKALNCPRSLTCWLLYTYGEHDQLAKIEWHPSDYNSLTDAADSLAASKYLSKADFLSTSFDRKKVAIDSYFEAEQRCADSNKKILRNRLKTATQVALFSAAWKIGKILGDIDVEDWIEGCDWGPGASTSMRRVDANKPNKYVMSHDITAEAYDFIQPLVRSMYTPSWDIPTFCIIGGSKIVTVPKNSKTDRTIAIEPDFNVLFQKGIGATIRRKLKGFGIDLNDQSVNAERARIGSKFGHLSTVDFSAASDSISIELCRALLPVDWFSFLMAFRSKYSSYDGKYHTLNKISSMGNGFTFELETLIFYALALASCEIVGVEDKGVSVYGDDVVLPVSAFDCYRSICEDLGLVVNESKSYSSTPFRESCGSFWWDGSCIKPIYLKEVIDDKKKIVKEANSVRLYSHRRLNKLGCDRRFRSLFSYLCDLAGHKTPRVSLGFGDCGIITNCDDPLIQFSTNKRQYEGYFVRCLVDRPHELEITHEGLLLYQLKMIGSSDRSSGNLIPRVGRTMRRLGRLHVPRWYQLGSWF